MQKETTLIQTFEDNIKSSYGESVYESFTRTRKNLIPTDSSVYLIMCDIDYYNCLMFVKDNWQGHGEKTYSVYRIIPMTGFFDIKTDLCHVGVEKLSRYIIDVNRDTYRYLFTDFVE